MSCSKKGIKFTYFFKNSIIAVKSIRLYNSSITDTLLQINSKTDMKKGRVIKGKKSDNMKKQATLLSKSPDSLRIKGQEGKNQGGI